MAEKPEDKKEAPIKMLDHLREDLQQLSDAWSKLDDDIAAILKILEDLRPGETAADEMRKKLNEAIDRLEAISSGCPVYKGGPHHKQD